MIQFGLRPREKHDSVWRRDPAVAEVRNPLRYEQSGDADHLLIHAGLAPLHVTWRPLTGPEKGIVDDLTFEVAIDVEPVKAGNGATGAAGTGATPLVTVPEMRVRWSLRRDLAFCLGVDFPGLPAQVEVADGKGGKTLVPRRVHRHGAEMLSPQFLQAIKDTPTCGEEMVQFYSGLVWRASEATPDDFFPSPPASSPPTSTDSTAATATSSGSGTAPISG